MKTFSAPMHHVAVGLARVPVLQITSFTGKLANSNLSVEIKLLLAPISTRLDLQVWLYFYGADRIEAGWNSHQAEKPLTFRHEAEQLQQSSSRCPPPRGARQDIVRVISRAESLDS